MDTTKLNQLRDEFKKKLDVNADGNVNLDDVIAFAQGNAKKTLAWGFIVGLPIGFAIGRLLK